MNNLLIEIGAEEIPAGYIVPALQAFEDSFLGALDKNRIEHGRARVFGTPRRLALMVMDVADEQRAETSTITGPPAGAGFDRDGNPTIAAIKFAEKAGIPVSDIKVADTPRGQYLTAERREACGSSEKIITEMLPEIILGIPFPKSMRWGDMDISFARPIISLTALFGDRPLEFSLGNINSSNKVFGHPFMYPGTFAVPQPSMYQDVLREAGVVADMEERRTMLLDKVRSVAAGSGSRLLEDEELLDTVTNLVEYPYPILGRFDEEFLVVPDEVLITAMREHQKYFSLVDEKGSLKPFFIAVNNTMTRDMELVARGHEKVLRARLSDAKFFYEVDMESTMDQFAEKLKKVTFQARLGSMFEKRERLIKLSAFIVDNLPEEVLPEGTDTGILGADITRAAQLCKADLVSQMVIEFTNLQGTMGRIYALKGGENSEVADAVESHYRPTHSGGWLPATLTGQLLAIADKMDTICGCFSIDLVPTGASDPYALRRQSIGILQIILASGFTFSLEKIVEKSVALYFPNSKRQYVAEKNRETDTVSAVLEFIGTRMTNMLLEQGYSREAVSSALSVSFDNVPDTLSRVKALDLLRQAPDFEPLSSAFKRVVNILKKEGVPQKKEEVSQKKEEVPQKKEEVPQKKEEVPQGFQVDPSLFESQAENTLYTSCRDVAARVNAHAAGGDYEAALREIAAIRPDVDCFFDDVMVMVDDHALRRNRLALLVSVASIFENIADFSKI
ncbi:MAG: glycine--tRNA ligase subunit beta [Desulfamplus sp.]|nr:glycine--tRNA ligase subunit beta [Desulfamplus sp.]